MTDIVDRLLSRSPYLHGSSAEHTMEEAANVIKRQREEMRAVLGHVEELRAELARSHQQQKQSRNNPEHHSNSNVDLPA